MTIAPTMTMGTIKKWKNDREGHAYGFAVADQPDSLPIPGVDIYINAVDLPDGLELQAGDRIAFTIDTTAQGLRAKNLKLA
jgi:cold shock CspA family protein